MSECWARQGGANSLDASILLTPAHHPCHRVAKCQFLMRQSLLNQISPPKKLSTWAGNSMLTHADQHPCHHYSIQQLCCLLQHHASRHFHHLNDNFNAIRVFGFGQIYVCTIPQHNIEQFCGAKVNQRTILHPITNKQTRISDFHLFIWVELYHHGTMSML